MAVTQLSMLDALTPPGEPQYIDGMWVCSKCHSKNPRVGLTSGAGYPNTYAWCECGMFVEFDVAWGQHVWPEGSPERKKSCWAGPGKVVRVWHVPTPVPYGPNWCGLRN